MKTSQLEMIIMNRLDLHLPGYVREHKFHATRRWRFDFAYPDLKLAIEAEGCVYGMGRHTRGKGYEGDCKKYNAAALQGWTVLRYTSGTVNDIIGDITLFAILIKKEKDGGAS